MQSNCETKRPRCPHRRSPRSPRQGCRAAAPARSRPPGAAPPPYRAPQGARSAGSRRAAAVPWPGRSSPAPAGSARPAPSAPSAPYGAAGAPCRSPTSAPQGIPQGIRAKYAGHMRSLWVSPAGRQLVGVRDHLLQPLLRLGRLELLLLAPHLAIPQLLLQMPDLLASRLR